MKGNLQMSELFERIATIFFKASVQDRRFRWVLADYGRKQQQRHGSPFAPLPPYPLSPIHTATGAEMCGCG